MDLITLARLLDRDTDVYVACRGAILGGANFDVYRGTSTTGSVARIYRRREKHTRKQGMATLGFAEAVDDLERCGLRSVLIGYVKQSDPPYHYQLFLTPDETRIVACLGVSQVRHRQP